MRVLQGLLGLHDPGKHRAADINHACRIALAAGEHTLGAIKRTLTALERPCPKPPLQQGQLFEIEEHPIIRPLSQYRNILDPEEAFSTS